MIDEQLLRDRTICYYIPFEDWTVDDVIQFVNEYTNLDHTWDVRIDGDDIMYYKRDYGLRTIITNNYVCYAMADAQRVLYKKFVDKTGKIYYDFKVGNLNSEYRKEEELCLLAKETIFCD